MCDTTQNYHSPRARWRQHPGVHVPVPELDCSSGEDCPPITSAPSDTALCTLSSGNRWLWPHCRALAYTLAYPPSLHPLSCPKPPPPMDPSPLGAPGLPLSLCLQCSPLAPSPHRDVPSAHPDNLRSSTWDMHCPHPAPCPPAPALPAAAMLCSAEGEPCGGLHHRDWGKPWWGWEPAAPGRDAPSAMGRHWSTATMEKFLQKALKRQSGPSPDVFAAISLAVSLEWVCAC